MEFHELFQPKDESQNLKYALDHTRQYTKRELKYLTKLEILKIRAKKNDFQEMVEILNVLLKNYHKYKPFVDSQYFVSRLFADHSFRTHLLESNSMKLNINK